MQTRGLRVSFSDNTLSSGKRIRHQPVPKSPRTKINIYSQAPRKKLQQKKRNKETKKQRNKETKKQRKENMKKMMKKMTKKEIWIQHQS